MMYKATLIITNSQEHLQTLLFLGFIDRAGLKDDSQKLKKIADPPFDICWTSFDIFVWLFRTLSSLYAYIFQFLVLSKYIQINEGKVGNLEKTHHGFVFVLLLVQFMA